MVQTEAMTSTSVLANQALLDSRESMLILASDPRSLHAVDTSLDSLAQSDPNLESIVTEQLLHVRSAQLLWAKKTLRERMSVLTALRMRLVSKPRELAATVDRDNIAETLAAEILPLLDACRFLEFEAPRILSERIVNRRGRPTWLWGTKVALRSEPLGVVLIIGPANYPLMLPGIQVLQAIAAGNGVLVKPALKCTTPVQLLARLAESVGVPRGLIEVLPESPRAATIAIRNKIDKLFLTGSVTTGRAIGHELAQSITPSVMELSGCDAVFVLDDADPELVSDCLLFGLTLNQGRTCMAPRRVFASDRMVDQILGLLDRKLRSRPDLISNKSPIENSDTQRTSLIQAAQSIDAAVAEGARLVHGAIESVDGYRELRGVAVVDGVTSGMSLAREDLFAPVVSFLRIVSADQALQANAKCGFALGASVFGTPRLSCEFARRIRAGCVVINDIIVPTADPRVPFGGRDQSGYGTTRGEAGLLEMTQRKAIVSSRRWFKPHLHPPTTADANVLEQLIRLEHASSLFHKVTLLPQMISATLSQLRLRKKPQNR